MRRSTLAPPCPRLYSSPRADVAQLARASACHAEGRGFESHHPLSQGASGRPVCVPGPFARKNPPGLRSKQMLMPGGKAGVAAVEHDLGAVYEPVYAAMAADDQRTSAWRALVSRNNAAATERLLVAAQLDPP